jgi:hypothetical protein
MMRNGDGEFFSFRTLDWHIRMLPLNQISPAFNPAGADSPHVSLFPLGINAGTLVQASLLHAPAGANK